MNGGTLPDNTKERVIANRTRLPRTAANFAPGNQIISKSSVRLPPGAAIPRDCTHLDNASSTKL